MLFDGALFDKPRCFGHFTKQPELAFYHDKEWGVPVYDDQTLFELLTLESAQAGLNWALVLKKREAYREAFCQFDLKRVAQLTEASLAGLPCRFSIINHTQKIRSVPCNARVVMAIQKQWGSFSQYLWHFVDYQPIVNHWQSQEEVPVKTPLSQTIAQDLKQRGMRFIGATTLYAYLQAVGLVNDHISSCWLHKEPLSLVK